MSDQLSKEYMPDDFSHGHGVESLESDYFARREFTINEVFYDGTQLHCTKACLTDMMRNIVRFTDNIKQTAAETDPYDSHLDKLLAKAKRFVAAARVNGEERARLAGDAPAIEEVYINEFHMSLHLDRSLEQGIEVAKEYVRSLVADGHLPANIKTPKLAYEYLVDKSPFIYRCAHVLERKNELDFLEEVYADDTFTTVVPFWRAA